MNITIATTSHQGTRATNQDQTGEIIGRRSACFVVCDGIAGLPGGEVAAKIARDTILENFDGEQHLDAQSIRQYVTGANAAIRARQRQEAALAKMGTTLVSLFIDRDYSLAYWAHAGDSRLYLFRRGYLFDVTTDHSLVQQMKDAGFSTQGINSNLLYFALGLDEARDASYSDVLQLEDGDVFLLCTDGFWHSFSEAELEQSLHMVNSPDEWIALMERAWLNQAPVHTANGTECAAVPDPHADNRHTDNRNIDNYSAIAVWVGSPQETTLMHSLPDAGRFMPSKLG
ncbi:serine/threonine-protein phosphatase [Chimaeribacter arupi]|uniref:Serine/threonine-protein phosphatase n=2 Tax=Yersiniaceae TaxID=1903411 RepID=A0A2N5ELU7_9GAMM|nr:MULTISPECIES: protein phosphatase 2C domain-containing protein [Yersiniaceae]MBS0967394.1 serine/threonine-protein phosphatase [Nissabacter archeti]MDV5141483.1 protein phosphatase 2C domain-containing protein [Chimaeribacter arupi]PLR34543.1 serine/threonine-protein phosphatase [Chimaeribacter arupi]PLR43790.1 serine/threonine-protein phosphatase [Chimaeribacter arupi]PLR44675.1 serine/threonine-protein phosphatase [Chimaeribacter arupi]